MSALGFERLLLVPIALIISAPALLISAVGHSGQANANALAFEVISVRPSPPGTPPSLNTQITPDGYRAVGQSLWTTIMIADYPQGHEYWRDDQLVGLPPWSMADLYDINARVAPSDQQVWQQQGERHEILRTMLRSMLADRFKLVIHKTQMEGTAYALLVGKHGPKLRIAAPREVYPAGSVKLQKGGAIVPHQIGDPNHEIEFYGMPMASLAALLSRSSDIPIVDHTGLDGIYDFTMTHFDSPADAAANFGISFDVEQLGLTLQRIKVPVQRLVVDSVAPLSPN